MGSCNQANRHKRGGSHGRGGLGSLLPLLLLVAAWVVEVEPAGAESGYRPEDLEAVLITKIVSFVTWPPADRRYFTVTVLGQPQLFHRLVALYRARRVEGRPVVVRHAADPAAVRPSDVLYIGAEHERRLERVLASWRGWPTLTIARGPRFAQRGVAINLYLEGRRMRFEINRGALGEAGLRASYRLLTLARIVEGQAPR